MQMISQPSVGRTRPGGRATGEGRLCLPVGVRCLSPIPQQSRPWAFGPRSCDPSLPATVCLAKREAKENAWGFRKVGKRYDVDVNGVRVQLRDGNLWVLAIPAVMMLGLAAVMGPLLVGGALAAMAVGGALSIGALALTFAWIPLGIFFFFLVPTFVLPWATLGIGLAVGKMVSMTLMLAAGGVGWAVVTRMLAPATSAVSGSGGRLGRYSSDEEEQEGPVVMADSRSLDPEEEREFRRVSDELKDFDALLADREEKRRREEWLRRSRGG